MKASNAKPQSANALYCSIKFVASVRSFGCSWSKPLCVILVNLLKLTMDPFVLVMTYLVTYLVIQHSKTWKARKLFSWRPTSRLPIDVWSPLTVCGFPYHMGTPYQSCSLWNPNEQTDRHDWKHYLPQTMYADGKNCYYAVTILYWEIWTKQFYGPNQCYGPQIHSTVMVHKIVLVHIYPI